MEKEFISMENYLERIVEKSINKAFKSFSEQFLREQNSPEIKESNDEELYTTEEACKILKCSKPTLHRWKKEGIVNHIRIGNNIRYKKSDLLKLAK